MESNALNDGMSKLNNLQKDVFKQKGGTLGLVIIAVLVVLLVFNMTAILAWATSLFKLVCIGLALAGIAWIVTDKKVRLVVSTYYMILVRKAISAFVKIDPVAICRGMISDMKYKIEKIETMMGKLNGTNKDLKNKIKQKKADLKDCFERMKIAESMGKKDAVTLESRQAERIKSITQDYMDLSISTEKWYEVLSKMADKAKFTVADAENELDAQEEKYKIVKLSHSTFKSAMSIINGDPDDLALYNQAFNYINEDIMNKIGEMDRVLNSGGLLDKIDIENEVMSLKGSDLMAQYEKLGIDGIFATMDEKPTSKALDFISKSSASNTVASQASNPDKPKYF